MQKMKFDISRLKGKLGKIRDRMEGYHIPYKAIFFIMGIVSTIWFLVRVIPKPSRATYLCMKGRRLLCRGSLHILWLLQVLLLFPGE